MMKRWAALLTLLVACGHQVVLDVQAPATLLDEPRGSEVATVTRVIDGDTIEVRLSGRTDGPGAGEVEPETVRRVRLLGIDTPESSRVPPGLTPPPPTSATPTCCSPPNETPAGTTGGCGRTIRAEGGPKP